MNSRKTKIICPCSSRGGDPALTRARAHPRETSPNPNPRKKPHPHPGKDTEEAPQRRPLPGLKTGVPSIVATQLDPTPSNKIEYV